MKPDEIRNEAVGIVDCIFGYTSEESFDPFQHRGWYNIIEEKLRAISNNIIAEQREKDAKIAEKWGDYHNIADDIAAAIRKQGD